ncbi:MAG TPA: Ppx/GppA phosphatase family protein [Gaiellales bacterium]|nr:Ppx/GppA phosphatase family protein [Gaiellales bacterium]
MTRVGAVDMGTNSTRLLVADVEGTDLAEIERLLRITRLGDRVDADGRLADAAMERVHGVLEEYAARARELDAEHVLATATSAVRDAANGREFLDAVERRHGFETCLLSGREEAGLTYRGVTSRFAAGPGTLVCDIGGGSTELVLGGPDGVDDAVSLDIGCVRMSERCLRSDPPGDDEIAVLREAVTALLPRELTSRAAVLVGVAGTVTTLATIDRGLDREIPEEIDGHRLAPETVEALLRRLAALPLAGRREVRGLMPERAPTIVAGAAIAAEVLRATGAPEMVVSERDILHGAALLAAEPG